VYSLNNRARRRLDASPEFKNLETISRLQTSSTMKWLSRFKGKVPDDYLFLPEEKKKRKEFAE
jgi:hypothetical protein